MDFQHPFYKLPLQFDYEQLAKEVGEVGEEHWSPHPQAFKGNDALILLSNGGTINDLTSGPMSMTPAMDQLPYLKQVLTNLHTVIGRTRLMRLAPGEKVGNHTDVSFYWRHRFRIHIPIVTDPGVKFYCEDVGVHMAAGECWTFDNWKFHEVHNDSDITRVHLVVDTVGSAQMWNMLNHQCWYPTSIDEPCPESFKPRVIAYDAEQQNSLFPIEKYNITGALPPADIDAIVKDFISDLKRRELGQESCQRVIASLIYLKREWRSIWCEHGDNVEEYSRYLNLIQKVSNELNSIKPKPRLRSNGSFVANVLTTQTTVTLREQLRQKNEAQEPMQNAV